MARGVNKVIIVGNLGADPETRAMPSGTTVANLRIATTENWKDRRAASSRSARSGTASPCSAAWARSPPNT